MPWRLGIIIVNISIIIIIIIIIINIIIVTIMDTGYLLKLTHTHTNKQNVSHLTQTKDDIHGEKARYQCVLFKNQFGTLPVRLRFSPSDNLTEIKIQGKYMWYLNNRCVPWRLNMSARRRTQRAVKRTSHIDDSEQRACTYVFFLNTLFY